MAISHSAQLHSRPFSTPKVKIPGPKGFQKLNLGSERDGLLYIPEKLDATHPAPLLMMLHGAGGNAQHSFAYQSFIEHSEERGILLMAPDSRARTWDVIIGNYGPDIEFIDHALESVFSQYAIDPKHLAIAGFSDGASYSLSVGIANGDLFSHVFAFSPGFMAPPDRRNNPPIFISHGVHDQVLPIEHCSRRIVPRLQQLGFAVTYKEFDGEHTIPEFISSQAFDWFYKPDAKINHRAVGPQQRAQPEGP